MISCKVHREGGREVLAACDGKLLGKVLKHAEGEFVVHESFYGGEKVGVHELEVLLETHENINLVGEEVVRVAKKKGLITEKGILLLDQVPHAIIFRM